MSDQPKIVKIGLVPIGNNKGKTKISLSNGHSVYVLDPAGLKVGDIAPTIFIDDPEESSNSLKNEIESIIDSLYKADQNNALNVCKSTITKLQSLIKEV